MIFWLTTKDLMERYGTSESNDTIENTNFLLLSPKIQNTSSRENVLNVSNVFVSLGALKGVGILDDPNSPEAFQGFRNFLLRSPKTLSFLATIIHTDLINTFNTPKKENTLFIITPDEKRDPMIQTFVDVIEDLFHYKINHYPNKSDCDVAEALTIAEYYLQETTRGQLRSLSESSRRAVLESYSKKQIKRMVVDSGKFYKGMPKDEMIDLIASGEVYLNG